MAFEGALSTPSVGGLIANTPVPVAGPSSPGSMTLRTPEIEEELERVRVEHDLAAQQHASFASPTYTTSPSNSTPRSPRSAGTTDATTPSSPAPPLPKLLFDDKHRLLKLRLTPLRHVQRDLEVRLGAGAEEPAPALAGAAMTEAAPFGGASTSTAAVASASRSQGLGVVGAAGAVTGGVLGGGLAPHFVPPSRRGPQEFYIRSSTGWKAALDRLRPAGSGRSSLSTDREREGNGRDAKSKREREAEGTTRIIAGCREDIGALWEDEVVKTMLARRRLRLEEGGGL